MARKKELEVKSNIYIGSRTFDVILIIVMGLLSIIFIYPFLNVLAISFSSNSAIVTGQVTFFPKDFILDGYKMLFKDENIFQSYFNTIIIAAGSVVFSLTLTSLMAYVMMVPDFVLRKPLSIYLLITMFFSGGTIPSYLLIRNLGLYNTIWALILPGAVSAYNVFVYRAFFKGISLELREAAKIDGAGEFCILVKIYVPLSKALYATFGMMCAVGVWNSYFSALLYIQDKDRQPIQMVLRRIVFANGIGAMQNANDMISSGKLNQLNVQYACIIMTMGPILLAYPFVQKYFVKGMQVGAVKG
ncbi:carbohydrate ABC transporter permease [Acetatifactor muris]|jgi:putative aldouronate transport system permease protein|uniref:Lactose transport system permease protein LacG n=1 Tax=Acetatifactor muris TaxID=879566 RepID=A0A2K4ZJP8_9FIRM|nr:carbohydrate ABC transporter permease [Acetatifactor muris]MCR2048994.1 carbohydrate ABC transporter permease [Acetatifactor muris]SOY30703.1 Lactose transport system permease protein LacG [Acetatifactor muris]